LLQGWNVRILYPAKIIYSAETQTYTAKTTPEQWFTAENFIIPEAPKAGFVNDAKEIKEHAEKAFLLTTGFKLPKDLSISVLSGEELRQAHGDGWSDNIQGFSVNKQGKGTSEVFVKKAPMDRLMLTLGHEIGHVLTPTLNNVKDEEAKAFAFSFEWMNTIVKHNIAGLKHNINPAPARNGVHDTAFSFVTEALQKGKTPMQAFREIARNEISMERMIETIRLTR